MGFWSLLGVASMPILQVLMISLLGASMASRRWDLLSVDARNSLNKVVFVVFTPSIVFASIVKAVTFQDIISWWFMPVNIGIIFLIGGFLGWLLVKLTRPEPYLEGLIVASCSAANLGNLPIIIIPAICANEGSPFGDRATCRAAGIAYASFSMALGGFYIWTHTYQLIRTSSLRYKQLCAAGEASSKASDTECGGTASDLLKEKEREESSIHKPLMTNSTEDTESRTQDEERMSIWAKVTSPLQQVLKELMSPPSLSAGVGFVFGTIPFLKGLLIGEGAPLRVLQDTIALLGDGTIPCMTLILGGNLTQGLRSSKIRRTVVIGVILVRYIILPLIGIGVVMAAGKLGLLAHDPLFHYVLMVQFTLPPAMNIGTMTQLFDVGQEECSVLFLWSYMVAAIALTLWSTVFMWILS
ncbi:hypothetical protein MLD38_028712 [Melastoma candidum]|uniref:Uncharacterized protein n=1 Tax=Melastoma candidum TaxID=119954 RepID=A0ACB9N3L4_9MYRT|nr:hypothetical protein MLD38_028712 [Melastoma candidum]